MKKIPSEPKKLVVYFPNWGIYTKAHRFMNVGMIPWEKVSVVNHAFCEVSKNFKIAFTDQAADEEKLIDHSEGGVLSGHMGEYKYYKAKLLQTTMQQSTRIRTTLHLPDLWILKTISMRILPCGITETTIK